jgi:hypothetical protein
MRVAGMAVGMQFLRQLAVDSLDLRLVGVARHAKYSIRVLHGIAVHVATAGNRADRRISGRVNDKNSKIGPGGAPLKPDYAGRL